MTTSFGRPNLTLIEIKDLNNETEFINKITIYNNCYV